MANNVIKRIWNQNTLVNIEALKGAIFQDEDGGHTFEISGVDNSGNAISLSGTVAGVFLRPDNTDVPITGSASGGIVSVTLPAECYDVPGRFGLTVFITAENKKTCIYAAIGTVGRTSSGSVAPGTSADVVDLINQISAAVATIPASWSGLMADIAPTYSTSAAYPVGAYVYYNGDLYRCTTAITAGETWTAAHWTTAVLGNDVSDLKSATDANFSEIEQVYGVNIFNPFALLKGKGISSTTGELTNSSGYDATGLIDIGTATKITFKLFGYTGTVKCYVAYYQSNETFIRRISNESYVPGRTMNLDTGTRYIRLAIENSKNGNGTIDPYKVVVVLGEQTLSAYIPYYTAHDRIAMEQMANDYNVFKTKTDGERVRFVFNPAQTECPTGEYKLSNVAFAQGGMDNTGSETVSSRDIRTSYLSGGFCIHNLGNTSNTNVRVFVFDSSNVFVCTFRRPEGKYVSSNYISNEEWIYVPAISGYKYRVVYHSSSNIKPDTPDIQIYELMSADNMKTGVFSLGKWTVTGIEEATNRAYAIVDGLRDKSQIVCDTGFDVNYYVLGGNITDLFYTPNAWDHTGSVTVNANTKEPFQLFVMVKYTGGGSITTKDLIYLSATTEIINNDGKTVDLFMFMGQSNMAGRGVTNSTWAEKAPVIGYGAGYEFRAISDPTKLYPASEPFGYAENKQDAIDDTTPDNDDLTTGTSKKTGSAVVAFMNTYYGITGIPVVGVSASEGGTPISLWQPETAKLNDAIDRLEDCVTWLEANGYFIRHKYMMWCQGENDASTSSEDYKTAFNAMFGAMKTAGIEKCFLVRIGEYNNNGSSAFSNMIQCQTEIAQETEDVIMATTDLASFRDRGLMKDKYHFYQAAYNEFGRYAGSNVAIYVMTGKEPTMYDPKNTNLYYSHKN